KVRPISLAFCLLKTLERMLNLRLCSWLEHHQKLPNRQFGFRRGKSCLDNLTLLNAEILNAFDENAVVAVLSIDIKGAEFADDDTFIKKNRDPRIAIEALEITMVDVLRFLNDSGLELSPDKCQLSLRIAMGYRQSTSTNIMFAEAKEPPIHLRMQYLCYNFLTKLLAKTKHPLIPILDHIIARRENPTLLFRALKNFVNSEKQKPIIYIVKNQLYKLSLLNKKVKLVWIPAHKDITYNELVDQAAKDSAKNGIDTQLLISASDFKAIWKTKIKNKFNQWCLIIGKEKGKNYFNKFYSESASPWFHNFKFRRKTIVSINRLRSGHTSLAHSLKRFEIV
ncbi:GSCOCG00008335001-RA-CDS, partial [Cotesia congregata]